MTDTTDDTETAGEANLAAPVVRAGAEAAPSSPAATLLERMDAVEERLAGLATAEADGLTDPDPGAEERWDAGQVWAHLSEFPTYWLGQLRVIQEQPDAEPVPFGRTKTDELRLASIEQYRMLPTTDLLERVQASLAEVRLALMSIPDAGWSREGRHSTLGVMPVSALVERFIVGHLEEHADQLDGLGRV
jgi:hypothetical protein